MSSEVQSGWEKFTRPLRGAPLGWRLRVAVLILLVAAIATVWVTNRLLTDRFTESTRNRAELRLALYSGNLLSELRRNAIVPQLLARDPTLISALQSSDFTLSTQRLISFVEEIGAASLMLLDSDGRSVAATDRNRIGEAHRNSPYFVDSIRSNATIF
ncbi:MAG: sensor histidine kinase, partial [Pseudomonadota bacterium]